MEKCGVFMEQLGNITDDIKQQGGASLLANRRGIALVTALMLTLISLSIVMALMFMITQGIQFSGINKRYKSVIQASYAGSETVTKDMVKRVFEGYSSATALKSFYSSIPSLQVSDCFGPKINRSPSNWPAGCEGGQAPNIKPDLTFQLQSTSAQPYLVYAKIIGAVNFGNTDKAELSNLREAHNVTEGSGGSGTTIPNTYRIEIQGERANNPMERARLSVLYAY